VIANPAPLLNEENDSQINARSHTPLLDVRCTIRRSDMEYILNNLDGGILKLELNRSQKRNALTLAMYTEFAELLNAAQTKPEIRVVMVSAAGDNYSAGNDLQDFLDHPPGSGDSSQKQLIDALRLLDNLSSG
jgi:enoyl-CoA hydratase/carnithine racemase